LGNVSIWDIVTGPDNMMYAAARDIILKITPEGKVSTYIKDDFPRPYGAVSIRADSKGNLFVSCGTIVVRYNASLEKTVIIDVEDKKSGKTKNIIGIEIDPSEKAFYAENQVIFSISDYNLIRNPYVIRNLKRTAFPHVEIHFPLSIYLRNYLSSYFKMHACPGRFQRRGE
jgi:hypothetical protein